MTEYSEFKPGNLKKGWLTPDGSDLKAGCTTSSYDGGDPSAAADLKPSLLNADGTLKASISNSAGLKSSVANASYTPGGGIPANYQGRPVGITGLTSITPKILISRNDSAPFPVLVQVSASETITNLGTLKSTGLYGSLTYSWDFGDSSGTETLTDHDSGDTFNANDGQWLPEAAYIYRAAGSYTITLTVTGYDENGSLVSGSTTTLLTAGEYYVFNGNATGGTFKLIFNGSGSTADLAYSVAGNNNQDADAMVAALLAAYPGTLTAANTRRTDEGCIEFFGNLAGEIAVLTADFTGLTGTTHDTTVRAEQVSGSNSTFSVIDRSGLTAQYWDSTAAGGGDGSIGAPKNDYASFLTFIKGGSNRIAYVKRGSSWTMTTSRWQGQKQSNILIEAYGTGAKPIFICDDTNHRFRWDLEYGGAHGRHYVLSNIKFEDTATATAVGAVRVIGLANNAAGAGTKGAMSAVSHICLDNVDYEFTSASNVIASFVSHSLTTRGGRQCGPFGLWNCTCDNGASTKSGNLAGNSQWWCVVGGSHQGGNADPVFDHFIYDNCGNHSLTLGVAFGPATQMSYCINCNVNDTDTDKLWVAIGGCDFGGSLFGVDFANSNNNPAQSHIDDILVDSCVFRDLTSAVLPSNPKTLTIRNCNAYSSSVNVAQLRGSDPAMVLRVWNTKVWAAENRCIDVKVENGELLNNNFQTDGTVGAVRVNVTADSIDFAGTWNVDGNNWYAPNSTSPFDYDGSYDDLATWNALAAVGTDTEGDPGWNDPANGDFS